MDKKTRAREERKKLKQMQGDIRSIVKAEQRVKRSAKRLGKQPELEQPELETVKAFGFELEGLLLLMWASSLEEVTDNEKRAARILLGEEQATSFDQLNWASREVRRATVCRELARLKVEFTGDEPIQKLMRLRQGAYEKRRQHKKVRRSSPDESGVRKLPTNAVTRDDKIAVKLDLGDVALG